MANYRTQSDQHSTTVGSLPWETFEEPVDIELEAVQRKIFPIDNGWFFKIHDDREREWRLVAHFPTNVHLDLMYHGMIRDPFVGKNELNAQWVGETPWVYRCKFVPPEIGSSRAILAFDGLDTYATVLLNGQQILRTEDMFIPERVDITKHVKCDDENTLKIIFESTYEIGKKLVRNYPEHRWGCWNGDPSRLAVRKAQYHYV